MPEKVTAAVFKQLLQSGANNLNNHCQYIDSLNVFPVPDGDTGTNMNLTFNVGVADTLKSETGSLAELTKVLSKGLLMGARGNSGVILSQIFRGFAQAVAEKEEISLDEFAGALVNGSLAAYKAVMRPVEGTILTVIRESSKQAQDYLTVAPDSDLASFLQQLVEFAKVSLANTPNLLPVLKEVGVIDSGGAGLLIIFEGFLAAALGQSIELSAAASQVLPESTFQSTEEFGYCTEIIIALSATYKNHDNQAKVMELLSNIGDSVVVVQDDDILKIHVHSFKPGEVLNICQRYGEFVRMKIDNMQEQHNNLSEGVYQEVAQEKKKYALIAVANGEGLIAAFKELAVDFVITGGQTMNPATEDFISAIEKAHAENIIILPNNSNIILTANQAATAYDKANIEVIGTKTIPQGLSACIAFDPELSLKENVTTMKTAYKRTTSASVTYAVKDSNLNGLKIKANDYMGILNKDIISVNADKLEVAKELLNKMVDKKTEILTIIIGENVTNEQKKALLDFVASQLSVEYEVVEGKQPVYDFIFGAQ